MPASESPRTGPGYRGPVLINIKAVSALLSRSESSIRRDDKAGRMPSPLAIGGSKLWRRNELRSWVCAGCPARAAWETRWLNASVTPSVGDASDANRTTRII